MSSLLYAAADDILKSRRKYSFYGIKDNISKVKKPVKQNICFLKMKKQAWLLNRDIKRVPRFIL